MKVDEKLAELVPFDVNPLGFVPDLSMRGVE
jgi:hypothetical protein